MQRYQTKQINTGNCTTDDNRNWSNLLSNHIIFRKKTTDAKNLIMARQHFDKLDLTILNALCDNARTPYLEIARDYGVSGAAVHQRVQRLIAGNVISGSHCTIEPATLGFHVVAYVGINSKPGTPLEKLLGNLAEIKEITECHVVTGRYDVIVKIHAHSNEDILDLIQNRMRTLEIANTETMVSFREAFNRHLPIENED